MIEKYGAIVLLNQIIRTLEEQSKNKVPGTEIVVTGMKKLANDINEEILRDFTGAIQNLSEYVKEIDDD